MVEASIFGGLGSFAQFKVWAIYGIWGIVFLIIAGILTTIAIMIAKSKTQTKIYELNMVTKRIRVFGARPKKNKKEGIKQLWITKLKRYLPNVQQDDVYIRGKQDAIIFIKDKNGLYHTARLPTYEQIKEWYKVHHNIDLEKTRQEELNELKDIYLLPNPHEDLDWLANQCAEATKTFSVTSWWNSPVVAYVGMGLVCFLMLALTLMSKKFGW